MLETEENSIENLIGKTKTESGFNTPDNYFDVTKSSMLAKIEGANLTLENQEGGFIVFDMFFETQRHQILANATKNQAKKISLSYNQWMIKVASVAAIFTIVGFLFLQNNSNQSNELTASISNEEIVNHLVKTDISEDMICELLDQNKTNKKENEIEKYLNENADEDLLIDNL